MTGLPFSAYIRSPRVATRSEKNTKVQIDYYRIQERGVLEFAIPKFIWIISRLAS
jgi:hypothetical protein